MSHTYDPYTNVINTMTKAMEIGHIDSSMFEILKNPYFRNPAKKMFQNDETFFEKHVDRFEYTWYYGQADAVSGAETAHEH